MRFFSESGVITATLHNRTSWFVERFWKMETYKLWTSVLPTSGVRVCGILPILLYRYSTELRLIKSMHKAYNWASLNNTLWFWIAIRCWNASQTWGRCASILSIVGRTTNRPAVSEWWLLYSNWRFSTRVVNNPSFQGLSTTTVAIEVFFRGTVKSGSRPY